MTDYDVRKTNKLSGVGIRMKVKNAEKFDPEIQQMFKDLIKSVEYPKQTNMDEYGDKEKGGEIMTDNRGYTDCDEGRICPKCGEAMILCEDEKTYYQIWECDGCGYKEED